MGGYILLNKSLVDKDLWLNEPFSRGQAWVDLLMLTNFKDGHIRVSGEKLEIKRGQCGWSLLRLGERWKWSRGKVKRFVSELESDGRIVVKTNNRTSIITICNYNKYQSNDIEGSTPDDTTDGHQTDIRQDTKKQELNKNKINKPENVSDQTWNDFVIHRKNKKAVITETVMNNIIRESLKVNWALEDVLQEMVSRNWTGFKAEWVKAKPPPERETSLNKLLMEGRYDEIPEY